MAEGDNKRFWQRFAGVYGPVIRRSESRVYADVCARMEPQLTENMCVLELACGTGQLTYPLAGHVRQWEATDYSEKMIAAASKWPHSDRLRFSVQDASSLPYEHSTFDAVVISNALHVMPRPEQAMREIRRVLRPQGLLFAPCYVHGGVRGVRPRVRLMKLAGFQVYQAWTAKQYIEFITGCGFSPEDVTLFPDDLAPLCYVMAKNTK